MNTEHKKKIGAANRIALKRFYVNGGKTWNSGMKIDIVCQVCKKVLKVSPNRKNTAKYCSKECQGVKVGERCSGKNHWNWKGGKPKNERIEFMLRAAYKNWRKSVFERDNYTCQKCGEKSCKGKLVYLHAHHIKAYSTHKELRVVIDNGITLCKNCHYTIDAD